MNDLEVYKNKSMRELAEAYREAVEHAKAWGYDDIAGSTFEAIAYALLSKEFTDETLGNPREP